MAERREEAARECATGSSWLAALQWLLPLALVALAYRASWGHGFLGDAKFLIRDNLYLQGWSHAWDNLTHDYFWSSSGNSIPYWRPWTKLFWMVEFQLFGREPLGYHLVLLGWFGLAVTGVQALGRRLGLSGGWGCAAGVLFGLHAAAVEPASMVMASSDVLCAAAATWALLSGERWLRSGGARPGAAHVFWMTLALGSKVLGALIAPLLTLWVLLDRWLGATPFPRRAVLRLLPAWLLVVVYWGLRVAVLGERAAQELELDALRLFSGFGTAAWGLLPFRLESGVRSLSFAEAGSVGVLLRAGLAWLALVTIAVLLLLRRAVGPLVLLAWTVASCLPVLLVAELNVPGVTGKVALSDRWLIQGAAATSLLVALALQAGARWRAGAVGGATACALWAALVIAAADTTHAFYRDDLAYLDHEERCFQATPAKFRTQEDVCRHGDRRVVQALARRELSEALRAFDTFPDSCPWERDRAFNRLSLLVAIGDYERAQPVLDELLRRREGDRRTDGPLHLLGARVMIEAHALERAERMLERAEALGASSRDVTQLRELLAARR